MSKAALDLDGFCQSGVRPEDAIQRMRAESGVYNPEVVRALIRIAEGQIFYDHRVVSLGGLSAGMILAENIQPASGAFWVRVKRSRALFGEVMALLGSDPAQ